MPTTLARRDSCGCVGGPCLTPDQLRGDLAELLFAAVAPWIGANRDAETVRSGLRLIAGTITDPRQHPTDFELVAVLEDIARCTGRGATLLDLADVLRGRRGDAPETVDALLLLILRAHGQLKHNAVLALLRELRGQHDVSSRLLRSREADPRQLDWLARTATRMGCLGLWATGGPPAGADPAVHKNVPMDIVGTFPRECVSRLKATERVALAAFPPAELIDLSRPEDDEIVAVIPVALGSRSWGLLTEVKPVRLDDVAKVNHSATLLTIALDEDQVFREVRLQERELRAAAMHDHLTGLPNRNFLLNKISQAIQRSKTEPGYRFAVLYFDLDRFKEINDTLGHPAGDHALVEVARRLRSMLRPSDTAGRIGGDEFVVLLDRVDDPTEPVRVAQRLEDDLARPSNFRGREVLVTASVGVTLSTTGHRDADDILRDADLAMYSVKSTRRRR
jgi:diguanylate cyclase (GGDEF)-like protein